MIQKEEELDEERGDLASDLLNFQFRDFIRVDFMCEHVIQFKFKYVYPWHN